MRGLRWIIVLGLAAILQPTSVFAQDQQQAPPPPSSPPAQTESSTGKKPSTRHQHDFLIKGTVFTQEGLGFAGAQIRIRKAGEKSFHWASEANSRGEFAIRVVQGTRYEVVVRAKGWKQQSKPVDATGSDRIEEMVFRMEREGKKAS